METVVIAEWILYVMKLLIFLKKNYVLFEKLIFNII